MRFCPVTTWRRSRGTASSGRDTTSQTRRRSSSSNLSAPSAPSSWTGRLPASSTQWEPKPSNRSFLFFFSMEVIFSVSVRSLHVNALTVSFMHCCSARGKMYVQDLTSVSESVSCLCRLSRNTQLWTFKWS